MPDIGLLSDKQGSFDLAVPISGRYCVAAVAKGYEQNAVPIEMREGVNAQIVITLRRSGGRPSIIE